MNTAQERLRKQLGESILNGVARHILDRLGVQNAQEDSRLAAIAEEFRKTFGIREAVEEAILRDWKVTERPRRERRVQP